MQRLVIDTNVLVSALISRGFPARIIEEIVLDGLAQPILTQEIWAEYMDVLRRSKFARFRDFEKNADLLLLRLDELAQYVIPTQAYALLSDADDNKFLEAAVAGHAEYLITGNTNDFTIPSIETTRIMTPAEYWQDHRPI